MADLKVSVIIELLGGKAKAGVEQFRRDFGRAQASARGEIGKTSRSMREGVESISTQLGRLEKFAAGYITLWKGIDLAKQLIAQADAMKQLEGRMKLATDGAASFRVAMQDVRRIADDTGQGLRDVGTLYGRLATALKPLGVSQRKVAEITEVTALALKVSGASAAESASAILQLSQAFGSGVLRGEEFNAVNEAAPRLMKALADGLGVPIGALRKMASDGEITAEVMARVLPQALAKLREEAAQLPPTVEQAGQRLKNAFSQVVSEWDKTHNATGKLAAGLDSLAKNMDMATTAAQALSSVGLAALGAAALAAGGALKIVVGIVALVGAGAAAAGLLVETFYNKFLGGDELDQHSKRLALTSETYIGFAKAIEKANAAGLPDLADKLQKIKLAALATPDADRDRALVAATDYAKEIHTKLKDLADQKQRLAELSAQRAAILAGKEKLTAKEAVDAQIRYVRDLAQARQRELQQALADLERYKQAAESAYTRAADIQLSTADRIRELRRRDMSEAQQQADIAAQAQEKIAAANRLLAEAQAAAARGDAGAAEKAAAGAEKFAQAAEHLGSGLKNTSQAIGIVGEAGKIAAAAATAVGKANDEAAKGAERSAASLEDRLRDIDRWLGELEARKRVIEIDAEIGAASNKIRELTADIESLMNMPAEKHVTVVTHYVEARAAGGPIGLARGGGLPGYGGGDRIPALLEAGEFVLRKEAVRHWGLEKIFALNAMRLPRFAAGGLVLPSAPAAATGAAAGADGQEMTLNLVVGGNGHRMRTSRETAMQLAGALRELARGA